MTKRKRLKPDARKDEILTAALKLAGRSHYLKVTQQQIALEIGTSATTVNYHFKTMTQLRRDLMRAAVKRKVFAVIAQGLIGKDPRTAAIGDELKRQAMESML